MPGEQPEELIVERLAEWAGEWSEIGERLWERLWVRLREQGRVYVVCVTTLPVGYAFMLEDPHWQ